MIISITLDFYRFLRIFSQKQYIYIFLGNQNDLASKRDVIRRFDYTNVAFTIAGKNVGYYCFTNYALDIKVAVP